MNVRLLIIHPVQSSYRELVTLEKVLTTSVQDNMYCVSFGNGNINRYPINNIFSIIETQESK